MSGEAVPEGVATAVLVDAGLEDGLFDGLLHRALADVVAADLARWVGAWIDRGVVSGEEVLPAPGLWGVGVLTFQRVWEVDLAQPGGEVLFMELARPLHLVADGLDQGGREEGDAVLGPFAVVDDDLVAFEFDVLDAQP